MKYKVGDLILVKKCEWKSHRHKARHRLLRPPLRLYSPLHLHNTLGIITEVEKHSDIFESGSTESDNLFIWLSQNDGREYYFYQDEIDGEVVR